jgi:hypothetical protein
VWRPLDNILESVLRSRRQHAILAFMTQTLSRSPHHRVILMAYGGLCFAIVLLGAAAMSSAFEPAQVMAADFVYYHLIALIFLLLAARHLFSLPAELKANWIFQMTEVEGRTEWIAAMDRFVLFCGAVLILAVPLPAELRLLGWRGVADAALFLCLGLLAYEAAFSSWDKLPFTCSHLTGKIPIWMILAACGLLGIVAIVHNLLVAALYNQLWFAILLTSAAAGWWRLRTTRCQSWHVSRLKFEDIPESAVQALNLLK